MKNNPESEAVPTKCPYKPCKFKSEHKPAMIQHIRFEHKKVKRTRKLRQNTMQHIPRPENFDIAGCGIELYYEHLTFIPDFEIHTVEYLDKERVCKKCRKLYKIDEALRKRRK
jgi:hypothetical protein